MRKHDLDLASRHRCRSPHARRPAAAWDEQLLVGPPVHPPVRAVRPLLAVHEISSAPYTNHYYAPANNFYNTADRRKPFLNGSLVDDSVPLC